jgi:hypothetical protein
MTTNGTRYHRTYRRTLLDMHIPDWDPDFLSDYEPQKIAELYASSNISGALFYCKSHMGLNYWPAPVGGIHPAAKDRDLVGEMVAALRARGIAPAAYHSVIFDNWAVEHHPEWAVVPATTLKGYDSHLMGPRYGTACANQPEYRDYEKTQIGALLGRYDLDAFWIDMAFWTGLCVCTRCRERFLLEEGEEIPLVVNWASPNWARYQAARERWLEEMTVEFIDAARAARPGIAVTNNLAAGTYGWFLAQKLHWGRHVTFVAGDIYGGRDEQLVISKLMLHLGQQQPPEFMTSRCVNLRNHTALKSEHMMLVEALATTAHASAFLLIDAIDPRGTVNPGVYERVARVFQETARYEEFLGGAPVEDVAIYYSDDSRIFPGDNGIALQDVTSRTQELPHLNAVTGAATRLQSAHIPFGVVTKNDLGQLGRYRVVVAPDVIRMSDEELEALRLYVDEGGCLYASGRTSLLGTNGVLRPDFGLADVYGAHAVGAEHAEGIYLRPLSPVLLEATYPEKYFGFGFPMSNYQSYRTSSLGMPRLSPGQDGEALATLNLPYGYPSPGSERARDFASVHSSPPWKDLGNPTIVEHGFGRGKCVYSAMPIETDATEAGKRSFMALMTHLLGRPPTLSSDSAPDVWLTAFDQPQNQRVVISALCYRTDARPEAFRLQFTYRLPSGSKCTAVRVAPAGSDVPFASDDGAVTVVLDTVDLFGMYLLEYQTI